MADARIEEARRHVATGHGWHALAGRLDRERHNARATGHGDRDPPPPEAVGSNQGSPFAVNRRPSASVTIVIIAPEADVQGGLAQMISMSLGARSAAIGRLTRPPRRISPPGRPHRRSEAMPPGPSAGYSHRPRPARPPRRGRLRAWRSPSRDPHIRTAVMPRPPRPRAGTGSGARPGRMSHPGR